MIYLIIYYHNKNKKLLPKKNVKTFVRQALSKKNSGDYQPKDYQPKRLSTNSKGRILEGKNFECFPFHLFHASGFSMTAP